MQERSTFSSETFLPHYQRLITHCLLLPHAVPLANTPVVRLSIYVLESSNSRRLTYFLPPFVSKTGTCNWMPRAMTGKGLKVTDVSIHRQNLIALLCIRPLRLFFPSESVRRVRIILLKVTHLPFVFLLWLFEGSRNYVARETRSAPPYSSVSRPLSVSQRIFPAQEYSIREISKRSSHQDVGKSRGHYVPFPEASAVGPGPAKDSARLADVVEAVDELRNRVEHLAAAVTYHQNRQNKR